MAHSEYAHGPELAWGFWLRTIKSGGGHTNLVDEDGRYWESVRDCLWHKRLNMSLAVPRVRDEQLELMLGVLASMDRRVVSPRESSHEFFRNDSYQKFYYHWLHSVGLMDRCCRESPLDGRPNDEGVAIIRMLAATRPPEVVGVPVGVAAVKMFGTPGTEAECDRARFAAAEAKARSLPFAFVREPLYGNPAISCLYRDLDSDVPLIRTVWTQTFADERSRARTFDWMYERLDRWSKWGDLALRSGAQALTAHLFALVMLEEERNEDTIVVDPSMRLAITDRR